MLTFILKRTNLSLFYIPMITEPLPKERNSKYVTYELGRDNKLLFELMEKEFNKKYSKISLIKNYFVNGGIHLSMLNPDDPETIDCMVYFDEYNRKDYFDQAAKHYRSLMNNT